MIQISRAPVGSSATDFSGTQDAAAQVVIASKDGTHTSTLLTRAQLTAFLTAGLSVLGEYDREGRPWNEVKG